MKDQVVAFLQRHPGVFVIVAVAALAGASLAVGVGGPGGGSSSDDSDEPTADSGAADDAGDAEGDDDSPGSAPVDENEVLDGTADGDGAGRTDGSAGPADEDPDDIDVPTDVDHARDPVDLEAEPSADDAAEVGRWWAATYAAHVGAEPGSDLADRLGGYTTDALRADIADLPPAATYTEPLPIEGVSVGEPMVDDGELSDDQRILRVTVETTNALAIYDVTLTDDGGWLVAEVSEL